MAGSVGIMQPYFFPYLGYFQLINAVDEFVFLDDVDFIKRGWINRNQILLNGDAHMVSVPLVKASQNRPINSIELGLDQKWIEDFYAKLAHAYKKAPYYQSVVNLIEKVMKDGGQRIDGLTIDSVKMVCRYLDLDTECHRSSELDPSKCGKAQERILRLCEGLGADRYVNPINGKDLYNPETFKMRGVRLVFLKAGLPVYGQFGNDFVPGLSIIDVMMFNSPEAVREMLDCFDLEKAG